jgi:type I restriction enzyme M protein
MALKKSELYSSLWQGCDELRGGMDASQYKDYVLVLLFVKYVSDKYAGQPDALIDVPPGGSFADMIALKGKKEIGEGIDKIIAKLAEANGLGGVIDVASFNNPDMLGKGQDMVDRLSKLVAIFSKPELDFRGNRAEGDDLLGDAYEFLMRHFATESGKSKGQFYTPAEVSRIMAKVIGLGEAHSAAQTIYDPACGSGSLLLKAHDEAKALTGLDLGIYGQEMDNATFALARMNMILHSCESAEIWKDNTLSSPHFTTPTGTLKTFDFAVANPPFSTKAWTTGFDPAHDTYERFKFGSETLLPPAKNGDYAFLLHILASLKSTGKGAVILPHGVLFRGNAEADIRKKLVSNGVIKGIIGLPANLFYGTGIPACIIVLDKENARARSGLFLIDASRGFVKDGNKNRLRAQDIHRIVDTFTRRLEVPGYSRLVPVSEIADPKNDYNLNLPRYIDATEPEDIQDIDAHLRGGLPTRDLDALAPYWTVLPSVRATLFKPLRPGYAQLSVPAADLKPTIFGHSEFTAFNASITALFAQWRKIHLPALRAIAVHDKPKTLIATLSESLLDTFRPARLVDPYDVYQHLMSYWAETMQDDVYTLVQTGWRALRDDGQPDTDLLPAALVVARYFAKEQAAVDQLAAERDALTRQIEELDEEHAGDDALLADARTDKGKLTKVSVKARLASRDCDNADERAVLEKLLDLIEQEAAASKRVKDAERALDQKVAARYATLTADELQTLVVEDKWLAALAASVQGELDRVSQALTGRIRQLADRYATPLPQLETEVAALASRVNVHLQKMGAV